MTTLTVTIQHTFEVEIPDNKFYQDKPHLIHEIKEAVDKLIDSPKTLFVISACPEKPELISSIV